MNDDIRVRRTPAKQMVSILLRDRDAIAEFSEKLENYMYVPSDDEPDIGSFIRYIDRRDFPPILRRGGYVVDVLETTIKLKGGRRIWTIHREFVWCFQKKRTTDYLLDAVANLVEKS